jgi:hypothetical protein
MLYVISAVFDRLPFTNNAILDALDLDALDRGTRPPAVAAETPSSTR